MIYVQRARKISWRNFKSTLVIYYWEVFFWSLVADAANFSISPKVECFLSNTEFSRNGHMLDTILLDVKSDIHSNLGGVATSF